MRNIRNRNNRGFTLIELLVVIAIIGILAAVVLVSLNSARSKSRDARRLADVRQAMTALELYYNDQGGYPIAAAGVIEDKGLDSSVAGWVAVPDVAKTIYLQKMTKAPTPIDGGCTADPGSNNHYTYTAAAANDYTLTFCLGGPAGGFLAGPHSASSAGLN